MQREIQLTADGSHTLSIPGMNVTYHSHHGAIGESMHVYINAGLQPLLNHPAQTAIHIFEMGFGTGLNVLLSLQKAIENKQLIHYTALELFPLTANEIAQINYGPLLNMQDNFLQLHNCDWEKEIQINEYFTLKKIKGSLSDTDIPTTVNAIYFDAFSPTVQPELWTQQIFEKMYKALTPGGILVTYCSKSEIRRNMVAAGFTVTKILGPWGKREMVRAQRLTD
jgi:tRNA U34 5-methylaminomethyl-2-thiouridine-forming methyltransferase MnmC